MEIKKENEKYRDEDYMSLNARLNLFDENGGIQFDKDIMAVHNYFLQHVNKKTQFFHSLEEKLDFLVKEGYYEAEVLNMYTPDFIKSLYKRAYAKKFRFRTLMGAKKFYEGYALKSFDGENYLERYEDRVCMVAFYLANGNKELAEYFVEEIIDGRFQPATPTFLNCGKKARGELVSCFLIRIEDNMESIIEAQAAALQLSKRGGGVALLLSNLREKGAPIKKIQGQCSGVIPVMKMLEDAFSYANQLGARQGAGAVYLNVHHPDILDFLDTKRENADEKIRIKTLSLGVVIPNITLELANKGEKMCLFSPYDVEREYGKAFSDIDITKYYYEMRDNPNIRKKRINPRDLLTKIAEIQFESGYPYVMFEGHVNESNPIEGRINMSNLCSEILQVNTPSILTADRKYQVTGKDISCNLGSMNIAKLMDSPDFSRSVEVAVRGLTAVSDRSDLTCVPTVENGNKRSHAIGLGQMNLHGYFGHEKMHYGSTESIDFTSMYFYTVAYEVIKASNKIAIERNETFEGFENSKYASGEFFDKYTDQVWEPKTDKIKKIFEKSTAKIPTQNDWKELKESVMKYGLYNQNLQAIPPTGSISYINDSTASIHPIAAKVEARKEGKTGRLYYPAPHMTNDNTEFFDDAYKIGPKALIDIYAAATPHVDQGLSLTVFLKATATTATINKIQLYAYSKGIKTIYYIRLKDEAMEGTEVEGCVSCAL